MNFTFANKRLFALARKKLEIHEDDSDDSIPDIQKSAIT